LETDADLSNRYLFVRGWQTTIRSIIFLWNILKDDCISSPQNLRDLSLEDTQGLVYVAGWVFKNIDTLDCANCRNSLFSRDFTPRNLLTTFKEADNSQRKKVFFFKPNLLFPL
jgi:hypothetical protein